MQNCATRGLLNNADIVVFSSKFLFLFVTTKLYEKMCNRWEFQPVLEFWKEMRQCHTFDSFMKQSRFCEKLMNN